MEDPSLLEWVQSGKGMLYIFKGIRNELPKESGDKLEREIARAELAFMESQAKLAKTLGYDLCQCTMPPQIMLWREAEKATVCPNPECGRRIEKSGSIPLLRS